VFFKLKLKKYNVYYFNFFHDINYLKFIFQEMHHDFHEDTGDGNRKNSCCGIPFDPDCMFPGNEMTNSFIITQLTEPLEEICRLPESSQMFKSVTNSYCGLQA
jgi:hypothetical protein